MTRQTSDVPHSRLANDSAEILVSVVMPCLNEARTLAECVEQAHAGCQAAVASHRSGVEFGDALGYEIIIADNGSRDGSPELARSLGARVVSVAHRGYGSALQGGIAAAEGRYVVMGDSDCSYDFGEVPRFLDKLAAGNELVLGNRFAGGILAGAMPWHHRYIGNPLLSGLGRLLYRTPCRDWHCGLRAFEREPFKGLELKCVGMEFASEMVIHASKAGLRIAEIPVKLHPDGRAGPSHLRSVRDGWRHLSLILRASSRKFAALIAACFVVVVLFAACVPQTFSGREENSASQPVLVHDFGIIRKGETHAHVFVVKNDHDRLLKVKRLEISCGCVKAKISANECLPGESLKVTAIYRVDSAPIDEQQRIRVVLAEEESSEWPILMVRAQVRAPLHLSKPSLRWDLLAGDRKSAGAKKVEVVNYSAEDWAGIEFEAPDWMKIDYQELSGSSAPLGIARQQWMVAIQVQEPASNISRQEATIKFRAKGTDSLYITALPVDVWRRASVRAFPESVYLSPQISQLRQREVNITLDSTVAKRSLNAESFQIDNPFPQFVGLALTQESASRWILRATCQGTPQLDQEGVIQLRLPEIYAHAVEIKLRVAGSGTAEVEEAQ